MLCTVSTACVASDHRADLHGHSYDARCKILQTNTNFLISLLYFTKRNPLFAISISKLIIFYRLSLGDVTDTFCLQSVSMPLSYALALNDLGDQFVHRYLGQEPSGGHYNEIKLDHKSEF